MSIKAIIQLSRTPISLKIHTKKVSKNKKNHFYFKFHSIKETFGTYMIMCIEYFGSNNDSSHSFHVDEVDNTIFRTSIGLKMHTKSTQK